MNEPRTHADIVRNLLRIVLDRQWQERALYMGAGDYADGCPDCQACSELSIRQVHSKKKEDKQMFERDTHRADCPTAALIAEAQAFLAAEERLEEEREARAEREMRDAGLWHGGSKVLE